MSLPAQRGSCRFIGRWRLATYRRPENRHLPLSPGGDRGGADLAEGLARRDHLGIELHVDERGLARGERALEGGGEFLGPRHRLAMAAIGAGERGEFGIV